MLIKDLISRLQTIAQDHGEDIEVDVATECCGGPIKNIEVSTQWPTRKTANNTLAVVVSLNSYIN